VSGWDTGAVGGYRVSSPDFVGRGEELDLLTAAFASAVAGQPRTVFVGGDAGVGKTRLVAEFVRRVQAEIDDVLIATGLCVPVDGGGLPLGPVAGLLRDIVRELGDEVAADVLGPLAQGLTGEHTKTHLFESVLAAVNRLGARSPVILVVDDLQWADSSSAELLGFMVRNLLDTPVLLVGAYRSDEVGPEHELRSWLAELSRHPRVTEVHLDGLGKEELTTLVAGIVGHRPDWTLVEAVWARSQGNPFFAEELTAAGPSPSLPPELARVILTRVEGLSKRAQQVLRILALAGMATEHRLLAATAEGFDAEALDAAVAESVNHLLLEVDETGTGYRFRHALVREAVEGSLLPGERARLHRRLADALSADPSLRQSAGALALHWWGAGEWAETYTTSRQAADEAASLWAMSEALVHLERALAALERLPADVQPTLDERLRLLDQATDVAYLAGAGMRAVELVQTAIDLTDANVDAAAAGRRYAVLGRNTWALGDTDVTFAAYRRALELIPTDPPSAELARVLAEQARGLMLMSRYAEAEARCHDAIAAARTVGARAEEGNALNTLGVSRGLLGYVDEALELLHQALAIALELGVADDVDRAYTNLSCVLLETGRLEEAAAVSSEALGPAARSAVLRLNGTAGNAVHALIRLGRWDEADALIAEMGDRGVGICATAPQLPSVPLRVRRGRFEEAATLLTEADERTARLTDVQTRGEFHMFAAELALEEGRPDDAYEEVERALALAAGTDDEAFGPEMSALGVRALSDRFEDAQTHGRRVDVDKFRLLASGLVEDAERLAAAPLARGGQVSVRAKALALQSAAEESRLREPDADRWRAAAMQWEAAGEPYPRAYCKWREAETLLTGRTERGRAADCLSEAWRAADRLDARPLQARVEDLARRSRIELGDAEAGDPAPRSTLASDLGLTRREVEVLAQLATGRTDKEIADALFISKKTASVHVSNLLRKLDVANRVEAGRVGQAHGLG